MSATAGYLQLIVDSTSVAAGERALDSIARAGARVEGSLKVDMGQIEQAMARLGQQIGSLDKTMTASMGRMTSAGQTQARTFEQLRASIDPAYASAQRFKDVQQELWSMVAKGNATWEQASSVMETARSRYLGVATAAERVAEAERETAQTTATAAQNYQALRASVDPLYATSKRYEAALEALDAAQKAGVITDRERVRTMQLLEAQMVTAGQGTAQATSYFDRLFASVGGGRFALKQTAFQLNQIAQQGAVTGNYIQALSVQSADLLTIFGTWGILAGGVIAVMGPLVTSLFSTEEKAKTLKDAFGDLSNSVSSYQTAASNAAMAAYDLTDQFGRQADAARRNYEVMKQLAQLQAVQDLETALGKLRDEYESVYASLNRANNSGYSLARSLDSIRSEFGLTGEQARKLVALMDDLGTVSGPEDAAEKTQRLNQYLIQVYGSALNIPKALQPIAREAANGNLAALQILSTMAGITNNTNAAAAAAQRLASAIATASSFSTGLDTQIVTLGVEIDALRSKQNAANAVAIAGMEARAKANRDAAVAAGEDALVADARLAIDKHQIETIKSLLAEKEKVIASNREETRTAGALAKQREKELLALRASLSPLEAYRQKLAALVPLKTSLSDDEWAQAIRNLNVELADSLPLVGDLTDALTEGLFNGFKGTLSDIGSIFKKWLVQMIATAAKNQIIISMGLSATGATGSLAAGAVGNGLGSSLLGGVGSGLLGGVGSAIGGLSSGVAGIFTGGGIGSSFANLGGLLSGGAAGWGAIGAALPAIGIIAGGLVLASKLFSRKYAGTAIRGSFDASGFTGDTFDFYKGGLLSSNKEVHKALAAEIETAIDASMQGVVASVSGYADALTLDATKIREVTGDTFTIWTNGKSEQEILDALNSQVEDVANQMAQLVLGTTEFTRSGETALQTLERLGTGIAAVNDAADLLGHRVWDVSLASADAASQLVELFGGVDAMTSAVNTYWQTMYSDTERQDTMVRRLSETFADLGYAMPRSRDQYRALVESIDTTTEKGRELYATLINMASALDQVLPSISGLTEALATLQGTTQTGLESAISAANEAAKANATAASNWYKASDSIREYVDKLRGSVTALTDPYSARAYNETRYQTTLAAALAGDLTAAGNLTTVAENLRQSVIDTAGTKAEAALAQARILSDLNLAAGVGDVEGARYDVISGLLTDQANLMQQTVDYLSAGNALTEDMISELQTQLGGLDDAIAAAQLINYAYLKDRLQVTVDVLADADVPAYLKTLLGHAVDGVTGYIDFLVRSDLTPDLKWLALTGASEHVATIEYLANNRLGPDLTKVAVDTISSLEKTVNLLSGSGLDHDTMLVALAGNSELSRIVTATLSTDIDEQAKVLALTDISSHLVLINAQIATGNTAAMKRLLASLGGATDGMLTLGGNFVFDPSTSFQTWFERNSTTSIQEPMDAAKLAMGTLTGALDDLRAAIEAETARAARDQQEATVNSIVSGLTRDASGRVFLDEATMVKLANVMGVSNDGSWRPGLGTDLMNWSATDNLDKFVLDLSGDKLKAYLDSLKTVTPTYTDTDFKLVPVEHRGSTSEADYVYYTYSLTGPLGGVVSFDQRAGSLEAAQQMMADVIAGRIPAFAGGGDFGGGLRLVGERGPELEVTGASRIYNASQTQRMLGAANDDLIAEVRALRQELSEAKAEISSFKNQSRQLDMSRNNDLRKMRVIEERREAEAT